jgi:hypothetical protein
MIEPEKPSNSAIFGGRLFTSVGPGRPDIPLSRPAFSAAVHLGHSVPTLISLLDQQHSQSQALASFEFALG